MIYALLVTFQKETMTQSIQSTSAVQIVHATDAYIYTAAKDSARNAKSAGRRMIMRLIKEKLVELLDNAIIDSDDNYGFPNTTQVADHLIAHGVTVQEWISVKDRLPDNKEHDWVLAQVVEDNGFMHIPRVMEYRQLKKG